MREELGGCEWADHPNLPGRPGWFRAFWFRLVGLWASATILSQHRKEGPNADKEGDDADARRCRLPECVTAAGCRLRVYRAQSAWECISRKGPRNAMPHELGDAGRVVMRQHGPVPRRRGRRSLRGSDGRVVDYCRVEGGQGTG